MSDQNIDVSITGNSSGLEAALLQTNSVMLSSLQSIQASVGKLNDQFQGTTGRVAILGGALSGLDNITRKVTDTIRKLIGDSLELADSVGKQADALGLTTEELSAYQYAASLSDIANEQLNVSLKKMSSAIYDAAGGTGAGKIAFDELGISVTTLDGKLKSNSTIMAEVADKLGKMEPGAKRTALSMDIFGKSGDKMLAMLKDGSAGLQDYTDEADRLGQIIGPELAAGAETFNDNVTKMQKSLTGMSMSLTSNLLPSLNRFTDYINEPVVQERLKAIGEVLGYIASIITGAVATAFELFAAILEAIITVVSSLWEAISMMASGVSGAIEAAFGAKTISVMEFFGNVGKVIRLIFLALGFAIEQVANFIASAIEITAAILVAFATTAERALMLDFAGAKEAWEKGMDQLDAVIAAKGQKIAETTEKYTARANEIIFPTMPEKGSSGGKSGGSDGTVVTSQAKSRTSEWAAELEATKQAYQIQNNLRQYDVQNEIQYWQQKLSLANAGTKEYAEIQSKIASAKIRQMQTANQLAADLQSIEIERARNAALSLLDIEREKSKAALDLGKITNKEYLAREREFEQQKFDILRQSIEARMALVASDPNASPAEKARLNAEMEALQQQHNKAVVAIDMDLARESNKIWEDLSNSMSSLWDKGLQSMMNGTLTWSNAYKAVIAELGKVFLNFAAQKLKTWITNEVLQTAFHKVQVLARTAMEKMGLMQSTAATAQSATAKVGANAAVAGSGAASAMASIPYVGPILAIAAMAAMLASVGALSGGIKSARGGYDIPAGLNPMAQLHEQEMVLPKEQAEVIRNMANGGSSGGNITLNVSAVDASSFRKLVLDNDRAIGDAVRQHIRNGGGRLS